MYKNLTTNHYPVSFLEYTLEEPTNATNLVDDTVVTDFFKRSEYTTDKLVEEEFESTFRNSDNIDQYNKKLEEYNKQETEFLKLTSLTPEQLWTSKVAKSKDVEEEDIVDKKLKDLVNTEKLKKILIHNIEAHRKAKAKYAENTEWLKNLVASNGFKSFKSKVDAAANAANNKTLKLSARDVMSFYDTVTGLGSEDILKEMLKKKSDDISQKFKDEFTKKVSVIGRKVDTTKLETFMNDEKSILMRSIPSNRKKETMKFLESLKSNDDVYYVWDNKTKAFQLQMAKDNNSGLNSHDEDGNKMSNFSEFFEAEATVKEALEKVNHVDVPVYDRAKIESISTKASELLSEYKTTSVDIATKALAVKAALEALHAHNIYGITGAKVGAFTLPKLTGSDNKNVEIIASSGSTLVKSTSQFDYQMIVDAITKNKNITPIKADKVNRIYDCIKSELKNVNGDRIVLSIKDETCENVLKVTETAPAAAVTALTGNDALDPSGIDQPTYDSKVVAEKPLIVQKVATINAAIEDFNKAMQKAAKHGLNFSKTSTVDAIVNEQAHLKELVDAIGILKNNPFADSNVKWSSHKIEHVPFKSDGDETISQNVVKLDEFMKALVNAVKRSTLASADFIEKNLKYDPSIKPSYKVNYFTDSKDIASITFEKTIAKALKTLLIGLEKTVDKRSDMEVAAAKYAEAFANIARAKFNMQRHVLDMHTTALEANSKIFKLYVDNVWTEHDHNSEIESDKEDEKILKSNASIYGKIKNKINENLSDIQTSMTDIATSLKEFYGFAKDEIKYSRKKDANKEVIEKYEKMYENMAKQLLNDKDSKSSDKVRLVKQTLKDTLKFNGEISKDPRTGLSAHEFILKSLITKKKLSTDLNTEEKKHIADFGGITALDKTSGKVRKILAKEVENNKITYYMSEYLNALTGDGIDYDVSENSGMLSSLYSFSMPSWFNVETLTGRNTLLSWIQSDLIAYSVISITVIAAIAGIMYLFLTDSETVADSTYEDEEEEEEEEDIETQVGTEETSEDQNDVEQSAEKKSEDKISDAKPRSTMMTFMVYLAYLLLTLAIIYIVGSAIVYVLKSKYNYKINKYVEKYFGYGTELLSSLLGKKA
jgi:hypothetical protein